MFLLMQPLWDWCLGRARVNSVFAKCLMHQISQSLKQYPYRPSNLHISLTIYDHIFMFSLTKRHIFQITGGGIADAKDWICCSNIREYKIRIWLVYILNRYYSLHVLLCFATIVLFISNVIKLLWLWQEGQTLLYLQINVIVSIVKVVLLPIVFSHKNIEFFWTDEILTGDIFHLKQLIEFA